MARAKKLSTVLTEEEQERLLEQPKPRYPTGERNGTMLRLMLNTGLRLAEVTSLKWHDVDLTTGKLMVRQGKGAKDRTLWVAEGDIDRLRSWRERQAAACDTCGYAFTTLQWQPLGHHYVQRMVKRYAVKAGIAPMLTNGVIGLCSGLSCTSKQLAILVLRRPPCLFLP